MYNESEEKDIKSIVNMVKKYDLKNVGIINKIISLPEQDEALFTSEYGQRFIGRLKDIRNDDPHTGMCVICQNNIANNSIVCDSCVNEHVSKSAEGEQPQTQPQPQVIYVQQPYKQKKKFGESLTEKVNALAGGNGAVELKIKDLFSDVFKNHTREEKEELFICGTSKTTPAPENIVAEWPKPWLYSRIFLFMVIAYIVLYFMTTRFVNLNAAPGMLFMGSLLGPFTVLMLFFEMNVPRNVSIINTFSCFIMGGCFSLLVTMFFFNKADEMAISTSLDTWGGAMAVGVIEELGKVVITFIILNRMQGKKYILNGILVGGAVGAGFAAFESMGYSMRAYVYSANAMYVDGIINNVQGANYKAAITALSTMIEVIKLRGILSPAGHVAWAAISGAALVVAMKNDRIDFSCFASIKFWRLFMVIVLLHGWWDAPDGLLEKINVPIVNLPIKYILLLVIAWVFLLVLMNNGFVEINKLQGTMAVVGGSVCQNCGKILDEESVFCSNCGTKIE